jgi:hypothetical protein
MRPHIPHTASEFCATPECGHHYNWHYPGSICAVPDCPCKVFALPTPIQETRPVPTTPQRAVIYLTHPQKWITPVYLDRLVLLRDYTKGAGYTLQGAVIVHHPEDPWDEPDERWILRRKLEEGRIDVLVTWDTEKGGPTSLLRPGTPCEHTWVTALDGNDQPARDSQGNTWVHCGLCGFPRSDPSAPMGGNQPQYPAGTRVLYDDDPGVILSHRYNGERDAYDALVRFTEGLRPGWCWESDLTPEHTEGE